jgi:hypothetical protein
MIVNVVDSSPNAPAGFCQQCGKPLTAETLRKVGPAVYCEPCLEARLHGVPNPTPNTGYQPVNNATPPQDPTIRIGATWKTGSGYKTAGWTIPNEQAAWSTSSLNQPGPNPGLAALLGLIPGVGAMYNEQYAKGIIHLAIFAVLCVLSDSVNGVFTLFIFGWIAYMSIEAHHTARARRDGTPLPNPFGFNDLAQRLGFDKGWPSPPNVAQVIHDAVNTASGMGTQPGAQPNPPYSPMTPPPPVAPAAEAPEPDDSVHAYTRASTSQPYTSTPPTQTPYGQTPYGQIPYAPIPPVMPPFDPAAYPPPPAGSTFPVGAVVLIGLGTIFLLGTTRVFSLFPPEALVGTVLLGFAAWIFLRRMTEFGAPVTNDFNPGYSYRLLCAIKAAVWFALPGSLLLLDGFDILRWSHSWPFFLIIPGIIAILDRVAAQSAAATPYPTPAPTATPAPDPDPESEMHL